jgi:RNA polymerase sigma-70 factor, ECF subfamily
MEDDIQAQSQAAAGSARQDRGSAIPALPGLSGLVAEMAQGRQEALAALYDRTAPMLNGLLQRMLEHSEDAEEVLLDVYMKAWKNASGYSEQRGGVQAWLIIMARNAAIDRLRQRRAHPRTSAIEPEDGVDIAAPGDSPEAQSVIAQLRHKVQQVLHELSPEQREALWLAFFAGYTHSELAEKLGEPLGTIKSRIRTGLLRLRTLLDEESSLS